MVFFSSWSVVGLSLLAGKFETYWQKDVSIYQLLLTISKMQHIIYYSYECSYFAVNGWHRRSLSRSQVPWSRSRSRDFGLIHITGTEIMHLTT